MRMFKRLTALMILAAMLVGLLAGCGMSESEFFHDGDALVIIVGNHANAHRYSETELDALLGDKLEASITRTKEGDDYCIRANVSIIVADGDPEQAYVTFDDEVVELSAKAKSIEKVMYEQEYILQDIKDYLLSDELRADDPEVDLLAAIAEAEIILRNYPEETRKHMVIYDPGITTAGFLNMNNIDIQYGSVDQVLERLPDGAIHNLSGINVTYGGLGNVCLEQSDMRQDSTFRTRLESLWNAYFKLCDADLTGSIKYAQEGDNPMLYVDPNDETEQAAQSQGAVGEADAGYPYVSPVPFKLSEKEVIEQIVEGNSETPIILSTVALGFKGDSAEFRSPETAEKALKSYDDVFKLLKEHPEITIYVVGSKAKTIPDEAVVDDQLSKNRSQAVANLIQKMYGFSADQVQPIAAGTTVFSWRDAVEFPDGTWASRDPMAQKENRVVAIIPSTATTLVQELIDAGLVS